ncbi:MAG: YdjY domain-containing protein [Gammaproteobacteria bacterium]
MKNAWILVLAFLLLGCSEQPIRPSEEVIELNGNKVTIVKLADGLIEIGNILVDTRARRFEAPGKFLRVEPPLEFLAVAKNGHRGYESMLELDVNVYEFNLACILIGLDEHKGTPPQAHFDPSVVTGDAVEITLEWETNGKREEHAASEFFLVGGEQLTDGDWVYTGSNFSSGKYLADIAGGTLVGFVHDPASIIEHGHGFGHASYAGLTLNQALMPSSGTPLTATFNYVGNTQNPQ